MPMKIAKINASLTTKLSLVITSVVILTLVALASYFDGFLQKNFLDNAQQRMLHGYKRLAFNLNTIESQLLDGIVFIKSDKTIRASIDLINNYQDKSNYNTYLIDEEKKTIALKLLNQVKLSNNNDIALYDQNRELIAFVSKDTSGYRLYVLSFDGGVQKLYSRDEHDNDYVQVELVPQSFIKAHHDSNEDESLQPDKAWIVYHRQGNDVIIESNLQVFDDNTERPIAYIEITKHLDQAYFEKLSYNLDINLIQSYDASFSDHAEFLTQNLDVSVLNIIQNDHEFFAAMKRDGADGQVYFVARLDKAKLNTILNENRLVFFLMLLVVATVTLLLMRHLIQSNLALPLASLMGQIRKIEQQDYSLSERISTGDELQTISASINQLTLAVQEREASLKKSEARYALVINGVRDGIWEWDIGSDALVVSSHFLQILGHEEREHDFTISEWKDLVHPDDVEKRRYLLFNYIKGRSEIYACEYRARNKSGNYIWLLERGVALRDDNGWVCCMAGSISDVTKRRHAEDGLRQSQKMDAVGKLSAGIAHEFRNVLVGVAGFTEMALMDLNDMDTVQLCLNEVKTASDRASKLTNDLLAFSRNNEMCPTKIVFDVSEVLHDTSSFLTPALNKNHLLEKDISDQPAVVEADPSQLAQVVLNLCINSRDAMPDGGTLTLGSKVVDLNDDQVAEHIGAKPGRYAQVFVSDTGTGIEKDVLKRLFDPFFTTKEPGEGTGLGLSVAYGIVKGAGGFIDVSSTLGEGAIFMINLPLVEGKTT